MEDSEYIHIYVSLHIIYSIENVRLRSATKYLALDPRVMRFDVIVFSLPRFVHSGSDIAWLTMRAQR